jgi:hypothetical protein
MSKRGIKKRFATFFAERPCRYWCEADDCTKRATGGAILPRGNFCFLCSEHRTIDVVNALFGGGYTEGKS